MQLAMKEKIGHPELFTGRRQQLSNLLVWVAKIKRELSHSRAMPARRKSGKTALLQRLYNVVYAANDGVIPFYYEVPEQELWAMDFCQDFFLKFIFQYIAFKSRNPEYVTLDSAGFEDAMIFARQESQDHLCKWIDMYQNRAAQQSPFLTWDMARNAPRQIIQAHDERVLQIIDEFQYLNRKIYHDAEMTRLMSDFAQPYMITAEYKNAPLLVAGSWVGLLMHDVLKMPGRFRLWFLENVPPAEALEMVYKYSLVEEIPVTAESAGLIADLAEGNPFYISEIMRSGCPNKDLSTPDGVRQVLEFETLNPQGSIRGTWMEYVTYAFHTVNDKHAKNIVLYLCQHREREVSRKELRDRLGLDMSDAELEKKLKALVMADIIESGRSNLYYRGVSDNIFDKVFRGEYADDISIFNPLEITQDYQRRINELLARQRQLQGEANHYKGMYAEFIIILHLTHHAWQHNARFCAMLHNLPPDFQFCPYQKVWSYKTIPPLQRELQIDIFAQANAKDYSLIGEVKNRAADKVTEQEVRAFKAKVDVLMELENVNRAVPFVFSAAGFTKGAVEALKAEGMAWSDDCQWIEMETGWQYADQPAPQKRKE